MRPLCCFDNLSLPLVVDASVVINLNATGCASHLIEAIPNDLIMVNVVQEELNTGISKGRVDAELTSRLVEDGHITIVQLGEVGASLFEQLVSGDAAQTLDDGEAATIALAIEVGAIALIDERKAARICGERFAGLVVASTVDALAHPVVQRALGQESLADAVFSALQQARMNTQPHHLEWVVNLIGRERAAQCKSLPKEVRMDSQRSVQKTDVPHY